MTDLPDELMISPIEGTLDADVIVPGSKSLTNRALVIAALCDGTSTLRGVGLSDDTEAMISAIRDMGVAVTVDGSAVTVVGRGGSLDIPSSTLDARMSGTSSRFLIPMLAVAGGGSIDGHEQLRRRPKHELNSALRSLGIEISNDRLPLTVSGVVTGSVTSIRAGVSSQFTSALLLSAPRFPMGLTLELVGDRVSQPYIDMTIGIMRQFGATVELRDDLIVVSPGGYVGRDHQIEPDASTATYPLSAAAIVGGRVAIVGLGSASLQGDAEFAQRVLAPMGVDVHVDDDRIEVRGSGMLDPIDVNLADMSDTAPTFAALAARANGTSSVTGIGFIKEGKESDRVGNPVTELTRLGLSASVDEDGFTIRGGKHKHAVVETYEDHRMAMSLALLGLVDEPVTISDPGCSAKTYPGYWDMLEELRSSARQSPLVLAIDGPAGSGKSTVARIVSEQLRLPHLDTGAMYRSVTLAVLQAGVALDDQASVAAAARRAEIVVGPSSVTIDHVDVTAAIREPDVTASVSTVAANPGVRVVLAEAQRAWARARGGAVLEGRDIGTAVFPDATMKIYLNATVEERARRRAAETGETDLAEMQRAIAARDHLDMTREADPLTIADDAIVVDTTAMSIDDVVGVIIERWEQSL
ncbi:MAG: 3-phosphoshikimate 1-carboxyvinyltransferase [Acidimicrobiia bacterium]|nr:3-phosphoshikimate 1-carboxyvinyltransferase [Acidimicrobiia bacterium]